MKKYNIIYADPPWKYGSKSAVNNTNGSIMKPLSEHYKSMSLDELKKSPSRILLLKMPPALCGLLIHI